MVNRKRGLTKMAQLWHIVLDVMYMHWIPTRNAFVVQPGLGLEASHKESRGLGGSKLSYK